MSEYREVLSYPALAFKSAELKHADVQKNPMGLPVLVSGGFALTASLTTQSGGSPHRWAVRCFHREADSLQERYGFISRFLRNQHDDFFVRFDYEIDGIQVGGRWYPIVKMSWVEGESLSSYVERHLAEPAVLKNLAEQLRSLVKRLESLHMAHGDLQHGNIIVRADGRPVLIDYDGMYVPEMPYTKSNEIGHPSYQHPGRTANAFDYTIDRFSSVVLYLSLRCLAMPQGKQLWQQFHTGDNLILSRRDFQDPKNSAVFKALGQLQEVAPLVHKLAELSSVPYGRIISLEDFLQPGRALGSSTQPVLTQQTALERDQFLPAADTTLLLSQEGSLATVVGTIKNVRQLRLPDGRKVTLFNFEGSVLKGKEHFNPFCLVVFQEGLHHLEQVRGLTESELLKFAGRTVQVTGLLEIYKKSWQAPNNPAAPARTYCTPQIILNNAYSLKILTNQEAETLIPASSLGQKPQKQATSKPTPASRLGKTDRSSSQPPTAPTPPLPADPTNSKPLPSKPVPPKPRQAGTAFPSPRPAQTPPSVPTQYRRESLLPADEPDENAAPQPTSSQATTPTSPDVYMPKSAKEAPSAWDDPSDPSQDLERPVFFARLRNTIKQLFS